MRPRQFIIVPKISSYPGPLARARTMLRWLVERGVVEPQLSACGAQGQLAHAIGPRASEVVEPAASALLPFQQPCNGLQIVTKRCIYTPAEHFADRARCPECRAQVGEVLLEHLEVWMPGETDNFICPECGHEDDINGFPFEQPCAFSDLGFIFNEWPGQFFRREFLDEFAARLGFPIECVQVDG